MAAVAIAVGVGGGIVAQWRGREDFSRSDACDLGWIGLSTLAPIIVAAVIVFICTATALTRRRRGSSSVRVGGVGIGLLVALVYFVVALGSVAFVGENYCG